MKERTDEDRRKEREHYHVKYPQGFKRQRNAEQTALQRAAQKKYEQRRSKMPMRKWQIKVRQFLNGKNDLGQSIVGCTREELIQHLQSTVDLDVVKWKMAYLKKPSEFDWTQPDVVQKCFHYTNLIAYPLKRQHLTTVFV